MGAAGVWLDGCVAGALALCTTLASCDNACWPIAIASCSNSLTAVGAVAVLELADPPGVDGADDGLDA
jgi:hypothetical protein